MDNSLYKNVLFTLAYYDAFDCCLSLIECWKYQIDYSKRDKKSSLAEVLVALEDLRGMSLVGRKKGFWFLKGKCNLAEKRLDKQKTSINKLKKAYFWAKKAQWLPYISGIYITGTLALKGADRKSDWDVMVVTRKGRIWVGRLLISTFFHLMKKRRHGEKIKNRFCLNHFLAEDGLILEEQNEYTARELTHVVVVFGKNQYQRLLQLNEMWLKKINVNFQKERREDLLGFDEYKEDTGKKENYLEALLEQSGLGEKLNIFVKKLMIKKIVNNKNTYIEGADIRYNDQVMVFLPLPQRDKIIRRAAQSLTNIC